MLNLGLTPGDRVAIWAPNFEFWYISMFATARAGLICVGKYFNQRSYRMNINLMITVKGRNESSLSNSRTGFLSEEGQRESNHCPRNIQETETL